MYINCSHFPQILRKTYLATLLAAIFGLKERHKRFCSIQSVSSVFTLSTQKKKYFKYPADAFIQPYIQINCMVWNVGHFAHSTVTILFT